MWNLMTGSIVQQKIRKRSYDIHKQKLQRIQPQLKITQPQQPWFIYIKNKKQMARAQQLSEIQRHNHLLLSKIKNIQTRENEKFQKPSFLTTLNSKIMIEANTEIYKENKRICDKIMNTEAFYKTRNILQKTNNLERVMQNISVNARRVQSAKSLMGLTSKIRPLSSHTRRPQSSIHQSQTKLKLQTYKNQQSNFTRPSSAPSIKRIKIKSARNAIQENQLPESH